MIPLAVTAALALPLSACGSAPAPAPGASTAPDTSAPATAAAENPTRPAATEAAGPQPRLAYTYQGGVVVLDAASLKEIGTLPADGFTRLADLGDQRHLLVTEGSHWRVLDLGTWTEPHGDHGHSYTSQPRRTDITFEGEHPGHAVYDHGRTMLFSDGAGTVQTLDAADLEQIAAGTQPQADTTTLAAPHHGVAVPLANGGMIVTAGTEKARSTIEVRDAGGRVVAKTDTCPGVHGEAVVRGAVTIGCEDGMVVVTGAESARPVLTKVKAPLPYARLGNQRGSEVSPVAFADYKTNKDATPVDRPTKIALVDTRSKSLRTVELGTSYWFRSLGRMPDGDAMILGYDGALHVIDVDRAKVVKKVPVIEPWSEKEDWQKPGPNLYVQGGTAYVTEPATKTMHAVDLTSFATRTAPLSQVPNELDGVTGGPVEGTHDHAGHAH